MKAMIVTILLLFAISVGVAGAQTTRHAWTDSLAMSTTPFDTTFSTERLETAVVRFVGCDGYIRFAFSPQDTTGWADYTEGKHYMELAANATLTIIKNAYLGIPGLYRVEARSKSGTGVLYIMSTKKVYE